MNMFAKFDENPAMTLQDIKKKKKRYGRKDGRTHAHTHGQRENSIPTTNKVCMSKRPQQTAQTQIRLLLKKQSDQGLPCLLF